MSVIELQALACGPAGAYISALVASLVFGWQAKKWARWVPQRVGKKGRDRLLQENKTVIQLAKALTVAGTGMLLLGIKLGWLGDNDWHVVGLFLGLLGILPLMTLLASGLGRGKEAFQEAMVAFAISERTPPGVLIGFMAVFGVIGLVSVISLLRHHLIP
jgi:hypothetical protein